MAKAEKKHEVANQTQGTAVMDANQMADAFVSFGKSTQTKSFIGDLLKFAKGDWLLGQDDVELKAGTTMTAVMPLMVIGWLKWEDGRPVDQNAGRIAEGFVAPARKDLGDTDKELWEVDQEGSPRDPWQYTVSIPLMTEAGDFCTFSTSSKGGATAVGMLAEMYGKNIRANPGKLPVVELSSDAYNHPNKAYGRIKVPRFLVAGWTDDKPVMEKIASEVSA